MNDKLYKSKRWEMLRQSILRRDGYKCQSCKRYGKLVQASMVHHIFPVEDYPEYSFATWNLTSLCDACHNKMHDKNNNKLSAKGMSLMERTALRNGVQLGAGSGEC